VRGLETGTIIEGEAQDIASLEEACGRSGGEWLIFFCRPDCAVQSGNIPKVITSRIQQKNPAYELLQRPFSDSCPLYGLCP
jgi:hypothetical protein